MREIDLIATVCKRVKFSAAHRLPGYDGDCARVHGHTFLADVYARGETDEFGMVVDYSEIKRAFAEITPDHQMLNDFVEMPSTENVASHLLVQLHEKIEEVFKVRLWEGPEQFAEVEISH